MWITSLTSQFHADSSQLKTLVRLPEESPRQDTRMLSVLNDWHLLWLLCSSADLSKEQCNTEAAKACSHSSQTDNSKPGHTCQVMLSFNEYWWMCKLHAPSWRRNFLCVFCKNAQLQCTSIVLAELCDYRHSWSELWRMTYFTLFFWWGESRTQIYIDRGRIWDSHSLKVLFVPLLLRWTRFTMTSLWESTSTSSWWGWLCWGMLRWVLESFSLLQTSFCFILISVTQPINSSLSFVCKGLQ